MADEYLPYTFDGHVIARGVDLDPLTDGTVTEWPINSLIQWLASDGRAAVRLLGIDDTVHNIQALNVNVKQRTGENGQIILTVTDDADALVSEFYIDNGTVYTVVGGRTRVLLNSIGGSDFAPPIGAIFPFAGAALTGIDQFNYQLCQGQSLLRTSFPDLFTVIGTTYGAVDGTHFTLPDMRGRVPLGVGTATGAAGATAHTLGQKAGEETHALTTNELPSHQHGLTLQWGGTIGIRDNNDQPPTMFGGNQREPAASITDPAGGGGAHQNMPPYVGLNYMIRVR